MITPEVHELGFARIILLDEDIAEVIIDKGVEMDLAMVNEYHKFLVTHLKAPFSLLINKLNPYSYSFAAQRKLATIPQIKAMAVVTYNPITERTTRSLVSIPRDRNWHIRLFKQRDQALRWLRGEEDAPRRGSTTTSR